MGERFWSPTFPSKITPTDPSLPHQIVLRFESGTGRILVSCNCLRARGGGHRPLDVRTVWQPGQAEQLWREHYAKAHRAA